MDIEDRLLASESSAKEVIVSSTDKELSMYKYGLRDKGKIVNRKLMYLNAYLFATQAINSSIENSVSIDALHIKDIDVSAMVGNTKEVLFSLTKKVYEI